MKLSDLDKMAKELISVQPISAPVGQVFRVSKGSLTEEDLQKAGYEPVCSKTEIMWVKKP